MVVKSKAYHLNQQVSQVITFLVLQHHVGRHISLHSVLPCLLTDLACLTSLLTPHVAADAGGFAPADLARAWMHQLLFVRVPMVG